MVCGDIMSSCHNISPGKPRKFAMKLTIDNIKSIFSVRDFQRGRMYVADLQSKKAALPDVGKKH